VPHENLLGEVNSGFKPRGGRNTKFSLLEYAANAVGVCDAAVQMATRCAKSAQRGSRVLIEHQLVQLELSDMHMHTEALRSFVMRLAAESDATPAAHPPHGHLLMNFASDAIQKVCYANLAIHASAGRSAMHARAEKLVRDAIIWTHIAGDAVQRMKSLQALHADPAAAA
jgi:alkylation response protein AidB-like acyl-CoA dehydrogenase